MKVKTLKVKDILVNPANARSATEFTKTNLQGLADSIKTFGVAVPIIVQIVADGYMLVAGHRRLAAAKLAKIEDIPAIIVNGDAKLAPEAIALLENQHRRDLTVIEEIKATITLLDSGADVKTIADKLGMTLAQVRLRKNVVESLSKDWMEAVNANAIAGLTVEHLDLIARMPAEVQTDILNRCRDGEVPPIVEFRANLKEYSNDLAKASWNLESTPCATCLKRSDKIGQGDLFPSEAKKKTIISCLDPDCYRKATLTEFRRRHVDALTANPGLLVMHDYHASYAMLDALKPCAFTNPDDWMRAKKDAKNAQAIFMTVGADAGKIGWFTPLKKKQNADGTETGKAGRKKLESTEDRLENLHGLRLKLVYADLIKAIKAITADSLLFEVPKLAAMHAVFGAYGCHRRIEGDYEPIEAFGKGEELPFNHPWDKKEKLMKASLKLVLWEQVKGAIIQHIPHDDTAQRALDAEKFCKWFGKEILFDWKASLDAAAIAKPEPKSWTKTKHKQA